MVMAHGFSQLVRDSVDLNYTLQELTSGQLVSRYALSIFNDTGFTAGPQGPVLFDKNGDIKTGYVLRYFLYLGICVCVYPIIDKLLYMIETLKSLICIMVSK